MLISIFVSIFGLVIAFRTAAIINSYKIFQFSPQKILILTMLVQFFLNLVLTNALILLFVDLFLFFAPLFLILFIKKRRKAYFRGESVLILDIVIAQMSAGKSFRDSLKTVIGRLSSKNFVQFHFYELLRAILFQKETQTAFYDKFLSEFYVELSSIDKNNHKSIEKLRALRGKLKTELEFHHKSRRATIQVRAQSLIITLMYALLFIYIVMKFGFKENAAVIMLSIFLFLVGLCWISLFCGRFRWKV